MESHREEGLEDNSEVEDSKPKPVLKESAGAQKLPLKSREVLAVLASLHCFQRESVWVCVCVGGGHRPWISTSSVGLIALLFLGGGSQATGTNRMPHLIAFRGVLAAFA